MGSSRQQAINSEGRSWMLYVVALVVVAAAAGVYLAYRIRQEVVTEVQILDDEAH